MRNEKEDMRNPILDEAIERYAGSSTPDSGPAVVHAYESGKLSDMTKALFTIGYLVDMVQKALDGEGKNNV